MGRTLRPQGDKDAEPAHPQHELRRLRRGVTAAIRSVDADARVEPDLPARTIAVETKLPEATVRQALAEAGFVPA